MDKATDRVLAVDVGNTTTRFGIFEVPRAGGSPLSGSADPAGSCSLITRQPATADEARVQLAHALGLLGADGPDGAILSCVVPALTGPWRDALAGASATRPLVVGPGLRTGIALRFDDPSEVGSDRIADAVAARERFGSPVIAIDLGTTTNFEVVDRGGAFAGGIIAPGIELGATSLARAAARLPMVELRAPEHAIGKSTRAAMQSGIVLGEAARIDGLLDAVLDELEPDGGDVPVVVTGSGARELAALLAHEVAVDEDLTLRGLALIWQARRR